MLIWVFKDLFKNENSSMVSEDLGSPYTTLFQVNIHLTTTHELQKYLLPLLAIEHVTKASDMLHKGANKVIYTVKKNVLRYEMPLSLSNTKQPDQKTVFSHFGSDTEGPGQQVR